MRVLIWIIVVLGATALVGCGNLPYRLDADQKLNAPILIAPDTGGSPGGPISVLLSEFSLDSRDPLQLNICLPNLGCIGNTVCNKNSKCVIVTLQNTLRGLEAYIPSDAYVALAEAPHLEELLYDALKCQNCGGGKLRILKGPKTFPAKALAITLAARLPRSISNTWGELYNYDPYLRSLSLVPGMRLRLEGMLPITADSITSGSSNRSFGSIAAPSYLYLSPANAKASGSITLSPALRNLGVAVNPERCEGQNCKIFREVGGLSGMIERDFAYWAAVYPAQHGPVTPHSNNLQFVREDLTQPSADPGPPAVLLVAARSAEDMAKFIASAKERLQPGAERTAIDCNNINYARCYVLRYRVIPLPEILVTVEGVQRWVEIGTTVGMVIAPHEPIRAARTLDGEYDSSVDEWRNVDARLDTRRLKVYRLYKGRLQAVEVHPETSADAIRSVILQSGDEVKWFN